MVGKPKPGLWTPPLPLSKGVLFSLAHDFGIIVPGALEPLLAKTNVLSVIWRYSVGLAPSSKHSKDFSFEDGLSIGV